MEAFNHGVPNVINWSNIVFSEVTPCDYTIVLLLQSKPHVQIDVFHVITISEKKNPISTMLFSGELSLTCTYVRVRTYVHSYVCTYVPVRTQGTYICTYDVCANRYGSCLLYTSPSPRDS